MQQPASSVSLLLQSLLLASAFATVGCEPGSSAGNGVTVVSPSTGGNPNGGAGGAAPPPVPGESGDDVLVQAPPPPDCADFELGTDEACDDGNRVAGDGCSANCLVVEPGYVCEPGKLCVQIEVCGDELLELGETCDDGNAVGDDGCSANCRVENGYVCPALGEPCVSSAVCGDAFVALGEQCDDDNVTAGDGCSDTCQLEAGWSCEIPGAKCQPVCGDGLILGLESCDDDNLIPGDGCSDLCRLEAGFACDSPGIACRETICQDTTKEGSEQCDDGNGVPYDGCTAACTNEPRCGIVGGDYTCSAVCGDGMKFPDEACDDGNTLADDGCSPTCQLEDGYACDNQAADLGNTLDLPIVYRDFNSDHPQFEVSPDPSGVLAPGIVQAQLGGNGKPVYNQAFNFDPDGAGAVPARAWTMDGSKPGANSQIAQLSAAQIATNFREWYTDSLQSARVIGVLPLALQGDGSFQFAASLTPPVGVQPAQFFPLDGLGRNQITDIGGGVTHNFHFTSEVRQWFTYDPNAAVAPLLTFSGDDDVWVFVNGQLTVDLGGIHGELAGSIELLGATGQTSRLRVPATGGFTVVNVPMNPDSVNEIAVFQAERHVTQSNYTLTLRGFNAPVTSCESVCGDNVITPDETCDDGDDLNGSGYGFCSDDCTPGPRCGDGIQNGPEGCDNGFNQDSYETDPETSCAPGCVRAAYCGDGIVDGAREQCDDGVNDGAYGGCTATCELGPRCGDGFTNGAETCDDGNRRNGDGCNAGCIREREPI